MTFSKRSAINTFLTYSSPLSTKIREKNIVMYRSVFVGGSDLHLQCTGEIALWITFGNRRNDRKSSCFFCPLSSLFSLTEQTFAASDPDVWSHQNAFLVALALFFNKSFRFLRFLSAALTLQDVFSSRFSASFCAFVSAARLFYLHFKTALFGIGFFNYCLYFFDWLESVNSIVYRFIWFCG